LSQSTIDVRRTFPDKEIALGNDDHQRVAIFVLALLLLLSVVLWLIPIRTPLWLDETGSYFQIAAGFRHILERQGLSSTAYAYIMWITKTILGSSEIALRAPSVVAMLGAVFVLYRIAREFFEPTIALLIVVFFSLHPIVVFAAIDARPYAFAVLALNGAILMLLRWSRTQSLKYAVAFGIACGGVLHFHYLFGVILASFGLLLVIAFRGRWQKLWSQLAWAVLAFAVVVAPIIPQILHLFRTSSTHVFSIAPTVEDLTLTLAPLASLPLFGLAALFVAAFRKFSVPDDEPAFTGLTCIVLGCVPLAILYGVSTSTPIHVFVERYRLVAIPGIALCWGLLLSRISSNQIRVLFCVALFSIAAFQSLNSPDHEYSWKYAIDTVNSSAAIDHAPVLVCSDLAESNFDPLPEDITQSGYYSPFSYYKLKYSRAIALPRALNSAAESQIHAFLSTAAPAHQRFLAMGFQPSWDTLRYITDSTRDSYMAHPLGTFNGVAVVEYIPVEFRPYGGSQ